MRKRRQIELFSISFLDLLSGALGAVIILYVAIPKNKPAEDPVEKVQEVAAASKLREELDKTQQKLAQVNAQLLEMKNAAAAEAMSAPVATPPEVPGKGLDVGFKFKGKEIVFIIDTSFSMYDEDRITQVKAGLKMLLTSLPTDYQIEIVQFPYGTRAPFKTMWGKTDYTTKENKADAFDFIYSLKPQGGTPTRDALLFVLENYTKASDIVLLTDGLPTFHNSNRKDDVNDILKEVKNENHRKIQINTIGVGSEFLKDKNSEQYKFLSQLAEDTSGFFVGF